MKETLYIIPFSQSVYKKEQFVALRIVIYTLEKILKHFIHVTDGKQLKVARTNL
jgi:hypothetical protein